MRSLLLIALLVSPVAAQGVLPLSGTFRGATVGSSLGSPCGPSNIPTVKADDGTITFFPDGTLVGSEICWIASRLEYCSRW